MPFCSERCRSIDLRRWLDEVHALPTDGESSDGSLAARPDEFDGEERAL